ncbi:MAG: chromate efflux transporter [Steroidobacteraceae bacterium]
MSAPQHHAADHAVLARPDRGDLVWYFLRLGAGGFGGPVALANTMHRDLVERRAWLSEREYADGLALATACPGPLAYQLGVYCGYVRGGLTGALLVAIAFAAAPFLIVVAFAALYGRFEHSWQLRAVFYGVAPVIVALILKACSNLARKTLRRSIPSWLFAAIAAIVTLVFRAELISLFVAAGLIGAWVFAGPKASKPEPPAAAGSRLNGLGMVAAGAPFAGAAKTAGLFLFFFKTGLLVFGSGLVIAPFLKAYVVDQYHWLSNQQFLDAVAIGMVTPGPVVITATFVGYLVDGLSGAVAATVGIFAPALLFTAAAVPLLQRVRGSRRVQGFLHGITTAVVGALFGTGLLIAESAIRDAVTAILGAAALAILLWRPRWPEPLLVVLGVMAGLLLYGRALG